VSLDHHFAETSDNRLADADVDCVVDIAEDTPCCSQAVKLLPEVAWN
jgi:hypothetical protein